jgi:hypothetical protein
MTMAALYARLAARLVSLASHTGYRNHSLGHENLFDKPANALLSPGDFVRHPGRPDWGLGQIQSMIGHRITVNFENAGKLVIDGNVVELEPADVKPR